jgi:periplasmic copper chaperone A
MTRALAFLAALATTLVGVLVLTAGPAAAHVTVTGDVARGGFGKVVFRVPNESDTATTVKVEVFLSEKDAVPTAAILPVPGWTATVQRKTLDKPVTTEHGDVAQIVTSISWMASPTAAIKDGEFGEFAVMLGPLPSADRLVFKALQTYSDGKVARWIEEPSADGKEPEFPAAVLVLPPVGTPTSTVDEPASAPLWLGVAGLVAGLCGLVLGALAVLRTRRPRLPV